MYEAGRVLFNQWMRDSSSAAVVAQANAEVAGVINAGDAGVADPRVGLAVNAVSVPTEPWWEDGRINPACRAREVAGG